MSTSLSGRNQREERDGKWLVTLMIGEAVIPDQAGRSSGACLSLATVPRQSAALASEEGASMQRAGAETAAA
jgi:hypothetical protein